MEIILRATVLFWFLWLVVRGSGKRALAELSPLDLILVVVLGDIVQQGVTQEDMSITGAVLAVSTFTAWALLSDRLGARSSRVARVLAGIPVIVIRDGNLLWEAMKAQRLTVDDLREAAREQGISDLGDVTVGTIEPDGAFSFIRASHGR
jgi:uncharacterized membrane protein YcaP (DUF421 family)